MGRYDGEGTGDSDGNRLAATGSRVRPPPPDPRRRWPQSSILEASGGGSIDYLLTLDCGIQPSDAVVIAAAWVNATLAAGYRERTREIMRE
jgi:hypothetical protein